MSYTSDKSSFLQWAITGLLSLLMGIIMYLGTELRAQSEESAQEIRTLKAKIEQIEELKADIREVRLDVKEILRRTHD